MNELKYIIFNYDEINKINFDEVKETSVDTLRKSIDETKTFIKYEGQMSNSVINLLTKSREYNQQEVLEILSTNEWFIPQEMS
jgi:hypothetical protein